MPQFETILFDLDGTLTDSKDGILRSLRYALDKMGIPCEAERPLDCFIGPPLLDTLRTHFDLCDAHAHQTVVAYREYFTEFGMFENAVYPDVIELLEELQDDGRILVLSTAKPTPYAETILRHFGLDRFFPRVVGANLDGTRLHKDEVIAETLRQLPAAAKRSIVMVGDREHDVLGARRNGLECIGVTYGYGTLEELQAAGAKWIVRSVAELGALLKG